MCCPAMYRAVPRCRNFGGGRPSRLHLHLHRHPHPHPHLHGHCLDSVKGTHGLGLHRCRTAYGVDGLHRRVHVREGSLACDLSFVRLATVVFHRVGIWVRWWVHRSMKWEGRRQVRWKGEWFGPRVRWWVGFPGWKWAWHCTRPLWVVGWLGCWELRKDARLTLWETVHRLGEASGGHERHDESRGFTRLESSGD